MYSSKLRWSLVWLIGVLVSGTTGYHVIEGWSWLDSLWMVTITLTTIGYGEVHPLSPTGKLFTIAVIFLGVGLVTFTITQFTRYVADGEFAANLRERRKRRSMERLSGHYIVVGCGRLGREVAEELAAAGQSVLVMDTDPESFTGHTLQAEVTMVGDGSQDEILRTAAIERARGLAVATGSDATNIFVTLSARQMNPTLHILTRVDEADSTKKAIRAGASGVLNPYDICGARIAQGLLHPHSAQILDRALTRGHGEFAIKDISIGKSEPYNGLLGDLDIPKRHKVLIVALRKPDGTVITPTDRDTLLAPGDVAIVAGRPSDIENMARGAGGPA